MAVRTPQEKSAINRMLRSHGLPSMDAGNGLLAELGRRVIDHEHLRSLLTRCQPEERGAMYDSLKPYLRFPARSLAAYMAESALKAERLPQVTASGDFRFPVDARPTGLCTCDNVSGVFLDDTTPMCRTCRRPLRPGQELQATAQEAVNEAFAKFHLTVTCRSCTKTAVYAGLTRYDAVQAARLEGWVYWELNGEPREICPDCPATR